MLLQWMFLPLFLLLVECHIQYRHRHGRTVSSKSSNCSGCATDDRSLLVDIRKEQIKRDLLRKLGLNSPPRIKPFVNGLPPIGLNNPRVARLLKEAKRNDGFVSDPPYLDYEEEQRRRQPENTYVFARTRGLRKLTTGVGPQFRVVVGKHSATCTYVFPTDKQSINADTLAPMHFDLDENIAVGYFEFSVGTMNRELHTVDLKVFIRKPDNMDAGDSHVDLNIDVFERLKSGELNDTPVAHKKLIHHRLSHEQYMEIALPVETIRRWFDLELQRSGKAQVLGLYVRAEYLGDNLAVHPRDGGENTMYLELQTLEADSSRWRRNTADKCSPNGSEDRCCLYDLEIDFEEAGWDFVIAPKRYNAQMCNGKCRLGELARYPHTKIMETHQERTTAIGPCCHPTEYDSIMLIYMTEAHEVLVRTVAGMIARRCGCA